MVKYNKGGDFMKILESGEMYLETIYILLQKNPHIRAIDIATKLEYSKPSVSRALSVLRSKNLIEISKEGYINFTKEGCLYSKKIFDRHVILTKFLIKLGINEEIAERDACKIEHVISDETVEKIKDFI